MALCPILAIAGALWVKAGGSGEDPCACVGSRCQWWYKCRRPDQCPKCGEAGTARNGGYDCSSCGWFDKQGDLIEYEPDKKGAS